MNPHRPVLFSLAGLAGAAALAVLVPAHNLEGVAQLLDHRPAPAHRAMPVFAQGGDDDARFMAAGFSQSGIPVDLSHVTLIYGDGDVPPKGSVCYRYPYQGWEYALRVDGSRSVTLQALTPKAFCISEQTQPENF